MKIQVLELSELELQEKMNWAKEQLIDRLAKDGFLNGAADDINRKYIYVIHKKNLFGSVFDKLIGNDENKAHITLLRLYD